MALNTELSIFIQIIALELVFFLPGFLCAMVVAAIKSWVTNRRDRTKHVSTKKLEAIHLYSQIRAHDLRGKATVNGIVAFTLEAEHMSDKKLYAWLEHRSCRWVGKAWHVKVNMQARAAAPAQKVEPRRATPKPVQPVIRQLQAKSSQEPEEMSLEEVRALIEANKGNLRASVA